MYDDYNDYIIKVKIGLFKTMYVEYIDWETNMVYYTKDKDYAGDFGSYERALEICELLERLPDVSYAEVIVC